MKVLSRLGLPGLLLAVVLVLASCAGGGGSAQQEDGGSSGDAQEESSQGGDMQGMDHGEMSGMEGMEGDSMDMEEMARQMVAPNGEYSDAAFVDAMVPHHEGAVEMAQVALENAEHEEIRQLSREIIDGQQAEIERFGQIRGRLGGSPMEGMSEEEMNQMMGMTDARELAGQRPFDRAFIDAMIPHHESAIAMANVVLEEGGDPEIREIAQGIVDAQEAEIAQMEQWRAEWYPEAHGVAPEEG